MRERQERPVQAKGPGTLTRRRFMAASIGTLAAAAVPRAAHARQRGARPVPTPSQLEWQRDELAMFLHFGVNTFTDREWGDGSESPAIFDALAARRRPVGAHGAAAGFRAVILTAKHHDGFCLWPTATTTHSVASSPWRERPRRRRARVR